MKSKRLLFLNFILWLLYSCNTIPKLVKEGKIVFQTKFVNDKNEDLDMRYMEKGLVIWFKDSCVIIETNRIFINTDFNNKETWHTNVAMYIYLD